MKLQTFPFDATEFLDTTADHADLLSDALETEHAGYIAAALGVVAKARGMTALAKETGLSRQALHKALSEDGNPTLETVLKVCHALGLQLTAKARAPEMA